MTSDTLDGKVAVITGAAREMGAAEAELFVASGARVIDPWPDLLDDEGEALAERLGGAAAFMHHDVADEDDWSRLMAPVADRHGRIDVLINHAGVYKRASIEETSQALYTLHYRVNQLGPFLGMRAALALMRNGGGGSIVKSHRFPPCARSSIRPPTPRRSGRCAA